MNKIPKKLISGIVAVLVLTGCLLQLHAQEDHTHFSKAFNREKPYRIFLPENYNSTQKKYPVVYFFHGNKGTHQHSLSETMSKLADENQVILVNWNGRSVDSDVRPYNIGWHSNINYEIQFKDYFPELVAHVDSTYRTFTNRENRGVIGHSMGGIMAFFLAGKYPQMIGAAVNIKGSPEFYIGYPDNHTLYNVRYLFNNLRGVKLRFHNSTNGELVYLNKEVNQGALHENNLVYEYKVYEGGHSMPAEEFTDAFDFVVDAFKNPLPKPGRWHHADLYPDFKVWGYSVHSNLDEPGFIEMHGVTNGGLGIITKKWQPEGRPIPGVEIDVKTASVYEPNTEYSILNYNLLEDKKSVSTIKSDAEGKISFMVDHNPHQIGIFRKSDPAELVFLEHKVIGESIFLDHKKECNLKLRLLNRGGSLGKGLKINLSTITPGVSISNPDMVIPDIKSGESAWLTNDFKITAANEPPKDGSPFRVRFVIKIRDEKNNTWEDEFDAPVFFDVPEFTNIGIDDGDSEIFGSGNGNNIAEPGEWIMIYEISHRTRLYYDDPYIDAERIHVDLQPDKWGDGYAISSVVHIAEDCPIGHKISFLAEYEVKEWKAIKRNVTWGTFDIIVGKDTE
jgi:enterochelin esterase-like enzyme